MQENTRHICQVNQADRPSTFCPEKKTNKNANNRNIYYSCRPTSSLSIWLNRKLTLCKNGCKASNSIIAVRTIKTFKIHFFDFQSAFLRQLFNSSEGEGIELFPISCKAQKSSRRYSLFKVRCYARLRSRYAPYTKTER